jgi:hypothetical protein
MKFITNIRRKLFGERVNREIFGKIFPHLNGHAYHGYPFLTHDEMVREHIAGNLAAHATLRLIEQAAGKMPKAQGDAFRYIAYRDLNERMEMYLQIAKEAEYPEHCEVVLDPTSA